MDFGTECISLNGEQQYALKAMLSGKSVFLSGHAGCGKSTVIREFKRRCDKNLICLAPTGMAAIAIGGETIHRVFSLPIGVLTPGNIFSKINEKQAEILHAVEVILVDEISMVRSDCFMAMDAVLRRVNQCETPFGGKQLIIVGDFCQLPPVVADWQIKEYLESELGGIFAFNTPAWQQAQFENIYLNHVYRQTDPVYLDIVNGIRNGEDIYFREYILYERALREDVAFTAEASHLDELNKRCWRPGKIPKVDATCLCCTRKDAEFFNQKAISQLQDIGITCSAIICGKFPEDAYPTSNNLIIKLGVKVMLLANNAGSYCNGDIGTVVDYVGGINPQVNVMLSSGITVTVSETTWSYFEYDMTIDANGKKHIIQREAGQYIQLPLAPGYAQTIHKAQGRTLNAAHIVLGKRGFFASGQLYTALTRCRSLIHLSFDRPVSESDIITDKQVLDFYKKIQQQHLSEAWYQKHFDD